MYGSRRLFAGLLMAFGLVHLIPAALLWLASLGVGGLIVAGAGTQALPIAALVGGIGMLVFLLVFVFGLPGTIAGWGLLHDAPWARTAGIIASVLLLPHVPLGTALGVFGLVVLLSERPQGHTV